jgi:hypothetical protein
MNFFLITKHMHQSLKFILLQNFTCLGHLLCPSSGVVYCTFDTGKFHAGLMTASKQSQALHVSGIFSAHHQEFSTFGTCKFHAGSMTTSKQSQDGPDCLEAVIKNLHETYQCRMYIRKLLMIGREDARNM